MNVLWNEKLKPFFSEGVSEGFGDFVYNTVDKK